MGNYIRKKYVNDGYFPALYTSLIIPHPSPLSCIVILPSFCILHAESMSRPPGTPDVTTRYHKLLQHLISQQSATFTAAFRDFPLVHSVQVLSSHLNDVVDNARSADMIQVSKEELAHLEGLSFLKNGLHELQSLPRLDSLRFVRNEQFVLQTPFARTPYDNLAEVNIGDFALSLTESCNRKFLWFENRAFDIFHTLKRMGPVDSERLTLHAAFYEMLLKTSIRTLQRLDSLKEAQWNVQQFNTQQRHHPESMPMIDTSMLICWLVGL